MRCLAYRAQKMVLHQRSVTLVANLLNGARSGPATGRMFAIAVTVVAKLRVLKFLSSRVARAFRKVAGLDDQRHISTIRATISF